MKPDKMHFGVLTQKGCAEIRERPLPHMGPDEVLVKQDVCNICTTDYQQWLGKRESRGYPMAGGHESAGTVVDVGDNVTNLQLGDKVALTYLTCGSCDGCRRGETCQCIEIGSTIITGDGYLGMFAFADYMVRPARALVKMRAHLAPSEMAFLEPLATVVKGLEKLQVRPMETIVVIGAGTMGLLNALAARVLGCRVIVSELVENKRIVAQNMGFCVIDGNNADSITMVQDLTGGYGCDAVILAVASTEANAQALRMVKKVDGRVLYFGAGYPAPAVEIDSNTIHYRRMELIGTFGAEPRQFCTAADMLNLGVVSVADLVQNCYPLVEIQQAFVEAATPGKFRVSVLL